MAGGEIGEGGDSQVINPLCELYSKNWDWTRREIPSVFDPAVQIQTKKQSLNVSLTFEPTKSLKGQAGLEEAAAPISENGPVNAWNAQWHYAGTMHVKWLYDNRILNLSQDLQAKTELLNTCIKKATIEYSNQKVDTDKRLRAEKEELVKISKERVELMERIEVLKTSVKEMKRRESDLQRHAEVEEKDFERFKESVFERAGSREEQIEEINNEIATLTETIEDLQEEKIAEMFSGNFGNRADVEKSTKAAAERKMKEKEIERLEASLARHRNDDEALRMEMNGTTEKIRAVKGKSVGQMFTFTSLSTSVKRLRKSAQSAEAKLKTTRDTARPLKRRLKELIEKDSLSPILLETIMVELVREKNGLNIVLDNLNSRKDELSDMTMELQRVKTRHGLENSKTFTQRMQREAAALEKETLHVQDEENKSFERILKLAKKEQALKDSLKREALEIQKLKNEIEESERKIKLTQTDIIAPKRIRSGGNAMERVSLSFTAREDTACGTYWRTHPVQVKFDRCVRTFHQHQEQHAEATVKLKRVQGFAEDHIEMSKRRWEEEEAAILTRKKKGQDRYMMLEEDLALLTKRREDRKEGTKLVRTRTKMKKQDIQTLGKDCGEKEAQVEQSHALLGTSQKQFEGLLAPQLKKQEKANNKLNKEIRTLTANDLAFRKEITVLTTQRDEFREKVDEQEKTLESLNLERKSAKEKIGHYNKTFTDMTAPLHSAETDRELQRQMANELGQQGIESSQELSRLRKENGEIRQKIEAIAKMKRETAMYHELHASGEWTALRIKTNKHIGATGRKVSGIQEEIHQKQKVVDQLLTKVGQAQKTAENTKRQEMNKLRKKLKATVMKTVSVDQESSNMKGIAGMLMAAAKNGESGGNESVAMALKAMASPPSSSKGGGLGVTLGKLKPTLA